jgi:hypothetical protein
MSNWERKEAFCRRNRDSRLEARAPPLSQGMCGGARTNLADFGGLSCCSGSVRSHWGMWGLVGDAKVGASSSGSAGSRLDCRYYIVCFHDTVLGSRESIFIMENEL